jgi:MFS superfamily sulfate permease-like transporter
MDNPPTIPPRPTAAEAPDDRPVNGLAVSDGTEPASGNSASHGIWADVRKNLSYARLDRNEIAGSLGDLGTFLPLLVGMVVQNGLSFTAALFFAGIFNVVTGLTFAIPMAVQPMKAIAAVAIKEGLTVPQILAAGATVSLFILVLGLTGLISWLDRVVPRSVVRGLQLSLGLSLMLKGVQLVSGTGAWFAADGYLTGVVAAVIVVALAASRVIPSALVLFAGGILLTAIIHPEVVRSVGLGLSLPGVSTPGWNDFLTAFPKAALPQIPLTTLNSVIAVCALSVDLFPDRPASPRRVSISVGLMNLVGCWFGAMPMCHGAGGLAGQYRFGARTNGSILFLGAAKILLAVLFGTSLMAFCQVFPASILGVMLAVSGLELALATRDQTGRTDSSVMLITAGVCLDNIALGFVIGCVLAWGWTLIVKSRPTDGASTQNGRPPGEI